MTAQQAFVNNAIIVFGTLAFITVFHKALLLLLVKVMKKDEEEFPALAFPKFEVVYLISAYEGVLMVAACVLHYRNDYSPTMAGEVINFFAGFLIAITLLAFVVLAYIVHKRLTELKEKQVMVFEASQLPTDHVRNFASIVEGSVVTPRDKESVVSPRDEESGRATAEPTGGAFDRVTARSEVSSVVEASSPVEASSSRMPWHHAHPDEQQTREALQEGTLEGALVGAMAYLSHKTGRAWGVRHAVSTFFWYRSLSPAERKALRRERIKLQRALQQQGEWKLKRVEGEEGETSQREASGFHGGFGDLFLDKSHGHKWQLMPNYLYFFADAGHVMINVFVLIFVDDPDVQVQPTRTRWGRTPH